MYTCMSAQGITYLVTCESHVILSHVNHMWILAHVNHMLITCDFSACELHVILPHVNHM